jgi:allantoate deiminase/N-carbamoyl-L-amino-acid hydrolase
MSSLVQDAPALLGRISAPRIQAGIDAFARWTERPGGVTRPGYGPLEREAHRHFADRMAALGASMRVDAAGNTIAELPAEAGTAAIGTGSHLDSVPDGGRFDGIAGVVAALEVATAVVEAGIERRRPWRFVAFAAEEGSRFGQACLGSRIASGLAGAHELARLRDAADVSVAEAMRAVGLDPDRVEEARWDPADWHGFVELHIEQGAVLESTGTPIGVVDSISGSTRLRVVIRGEASHTGSTPMHLRRDALVTASECVLVGDEVARDAEHFGTRFTVGTMTVLPGAMTTIPGEVVFTVDIRDIDGARQRATARSLAARFEAIAARRGTAIEIDVVGDTSPTVLSTRVSELIASCARELGLDYRVMFSGASHDTQQVAHLMPAGMIFVPSRGGLSHVPEEFTTADQIAVGARLLLTSLLRMDAE